MQLGKILEQALSQTAFGTIAAKDFLDGHRSLPRYALGKNTETLNIHRIASLDGIIDDYAGHGEFWNGIPLIHTDAARKDGYVVNCSTSIRPVDALDHLLASDFREVISLPDLICAADGALPWPNFVNAQRHEIEAHIDVLQAIYDDFADEVSRKTLLDVLLFRMTADPTHMRGYSVRISEQYFENFMEYQNEIFVDAGGFDGDTAEAFAQRYPDYQKILLFEPSSRNMALARHRLTPFRDISFFPIGLSNTSGHLHFNSESGSASSIRDSGSDEIQVDALDTIVSEPVSFIKMDLEGWELPALEGAKEHIRRAAPKLAIAAYHDAPDLRRIYQFIQSLGHEYQLFLRHYTQGWSETVLFFKPKI